MSDAFVTAVREAADAALPRLPGAGVAWLDAARRAQLAAFLRDGLPSARSEAWKYTSLRALEQRAFALGDAGAVTHAVDAQTLALPGVVGPRLVFVNGAYRADLSLLDGLPEGLELQLLASALARDAESLRDAFGATATDAFDRLNATLAADGVLLRVAADVRIAAPVHLVYLGAPAAGDLAWHDRTVIELGEGAELTLVEQHGDAGPHAHLGNVVSDIRLQRGARLHWNVLQEAGPGATLIRRSAFRLAADAVVTLHALELGGALVRHVITAALEGDRARFVSRGVFAPDGRQHLETRLDIRHLACDTVSDALWRGVADGRGRGVLHGAITVAAGADGADAQLGNKNLLLSAQAEIDTQPVLEIHADEVKASHGATVGQLDECALFYLRSRGLPLEQARALLTAAFCRVALDGLDRAPLREHLAARLAQHLPRLAGD